MAHLLAAIHREYTKLDTRPTSVAISGSQWLGAERAKMGHRTFLQVFAPTRMDSATVKLAAIAASGNPPALLALS